MIYEHFRATGAYEAVQRLSYLFIIRLHNDDVQDFDGIKLYYQQATRFQVWSWKDCTVKITGLCSASDRLGFVRSRNRSQQWADKLFTIEDVCKTTCRSDDENSKLQSPDRSCGKRSSHQDSKRKESLRWGESDRVFYWKAYGPCSKGDSCSFSYDKIAPDNSGGGQRRRGRSSSPAPNSKAKTDEGGENLEQHQATERKTLQTKGAKFRAATESIKARHGIVGILPCVKTTSLRPGANLEEHVPSDMLRLRRSPARSQRKVVRKDQLHHWREQRWKLWQMKSDPLPMHFFSKKIRDVKFWHPLVYQNYKSETGCICGDKCQFRHGDAEDGSRKWVPTEMVLEGLPVKSAGSCSASDCIGCVWTRNIRNNDNRAFPDWRHQQHVILMRQWGGKTSEPRTK